jgi:2-oxoglutarate dehydrogenase E1 component
VLGLEYATVREMLAILRRTYCGTIGFEFMHISDPAEKAWMQQRIEGPDKEISIHQGRQARHPDEAGRGRGLREILRHQIHRHASALAWTAREAMIPALEQIIKRGGAISGVKDIVLGMAHRGRLNVLSQVMGKPHRAIFNEFKGGSFTPDDVEGSGDVKYHLGASSDREFDNNSVHLSLTANPSHLEIVDPGRARQGARQAGSAR